MTAYSAISAAPDDIADIRARLLVARDLALRFVAQEPPSITHRIMGCMVEIANHFALSKDVPAVAIEDALKLCRHLMVAQSIAGQLDGTYPTDRYGS